MSRSLPHNLIERMAAGGRVYDTNNLLNWGSVLATLFGVVVGAAATVTTGYLNDRLTRDRELLRDRRDILFRHYIARINAWKMFVSIASELQSQSQTFAKIEERHKAQNDRAEAAKRHAQRETAELFGHLTFAFRDAKFTKQIVDALGEIAATRYSEFRLVKLANEQYRQCQAEMLKLISQTECELGLGKDRSTDLSGSDPPPVSKVAEASALRSRIEVDVSSSRESQDPRTKRSSSGL